ncbi:MAG: hypothetical protein IJY59_03905 [Bacteroidaceae bacterium]|nr:hypothetical protein [Bacteroidaceae bacterium]
MTKKPDLSLLAPPFTNNLDGASLVRQRLRLHRLTLAVSHAIETASIGT